MSHDANHPWVPSNLSSLQFDSCTHPTNWLADVFKTVYPSGGEYPMLETYEVLTEGYRRYWDAQNITHPEPSELIGWYFDEVYLKNSTTIAKAVEVFVQDKCLDVFCRKLPWQGNPDQAGRGMLATYSLEAAGVTVFVVVLFLGRYGRAVSNNELRKQCRRIHEATQETLRSFLDAALLFSVSMLIATIYTFGAAISETNKTFTFSSIVMSAAASLFSIFPAIALHSSAADHLRRGRYRACIWGFIGALTIVTITLAVYSAYAIYKRALNDVEGTLRNDQGGQMMFEQICSNIPALQSFGFSLIATFCILGIFVLLYLLLLFLWSRPSLKTNKFLTKLGNKWRSITAILAIIAMWASFGIFAYYRKVLDTRSGDTNQANSWSFGQILALSTFAPMVVEFGFIWWKGAANALTGLMSDRYHVTAAKKDALPIVESNTRVEEKL